jgi:hypothetical protein
MHFIIIYSFTQRKSHHLNKISSPSTTTNTTPLDFTSFGRHLTSSLHDSCQQALILATDIISGRALFTKKIFLDVPHDEGHPLPKNFKLITYSYQSVYELVGTEMRTPWNLHQRALRVHFPVISEWVNPTDEKRLMRNVIAHNFRTRMFYKDEEGYLADESESDRLAEDENEFSARKLWRIVEKHLPPLLEELERAVKQFGEEKGKLPILLPWKEKKAVEDMTLPEDPLGWSGNGDFGDIVAEKSDEVPPAWEGVEELGTGDEGYGSEAGMEFQSRISSALLFVST